MIYDCPVRTVLYVKRVNSTIIIKKGIDSKSVKIECYSIYRFMQKKSRLLENAHLIINSFYCPLAQRALHVYNKIMYYMYMYIATEKQLVFG